MTTRILTKATATDMANQLEALGATVTHTDTGIVATTRKGKEVFRAMVGTGGTYLTRWHTGLFDTALYKGRGNPAPLPPPLPPIVARRTSNNDSTTA